jgi:hypothetical protein
MGFAVIHAKALAETQLRQQPLVQKGQQDRAIGGAFDRHGREQPLETQGAEHGYRAAPIDGLRRLRALAPRRTGLEARHRLMAARFIETEEVIRSKRLDGGLKRGPLPLHFWLLWLGGAKGFFTRQALCGSCPADRGGTHRELLGGSKTCAEFLERRLRGGVHEGLEGVTPRGIERGGRAASVRFGGDVTGGTIACEQVADTAQTDAKPCRQLPHRALTVRVGVYDTAP